MMALLASLLLIVSVPIWLLIPPKETPISSDVVVVIAGSSDGRHQLGAKLVEDGIAENFVVSNPARKKDAVGSAHCRGHDQPKSAVESWCLQPQPVTTTGEALAMGKLAEKEKWTTATVVTTRTHARRVRTMFEQCTNLNVSVVYTDYIRKETIKAVVLHEIGGYIKFWLTNPCGDVPENQTKDYSPSSGFRGRGW